MQVLIWGTFNTYGLAWYMYSAPVGLRQGCALSPWLFNVSLDVGRVQM